MTRDPGDLGDAKSREEIRNYRAAAERKKSDNPELAYLPRWVPTGNWRMSLGDLIFAVIGAAILLVVVGMRLIGLFR